MSTNVVAQSISTISNALITAPGMMYSAYGALLVGKAFTITSYKVFSYGFNFFFPKSLPEYKTENSYKVDGNVNLQEEHLKKDTHTFFSFIPLVGKENASISHLVKNGVKAGILGLILLESANYLFGPMNRNFRLISSSFGMDFIQGDRLDHLKRIWNA